MSSPEKHADVDTQQADEVVSAKEKRADDNKKAKYLQKQTSVEVSEDDDVKMNVEKTCHDEKKNGESSYNSMRKPLVTTARVTMM
ncbi:hypothetical protein HPB52_023444 [Rhipicephalus sanguineus]|uniref:Uncharacterized protein n=1 Tax=Rhipicephalus sanguineus TaxID=34632 RepID=A0A9D4Q3G6_RHISA|nr:hypothetical protein HPB52_023444 [Rhipicephalus sanguineus]